MSPLADPIGPSLHGRGLFVPGGGALAEGLRARLTALGGTVLTRRPEAGAAALDGAIVCLPWGLVQADAAAGAVIDVAALLDAEPGLRHVVLVAARGATATGSPMSRLAQTLAIYATAHTATVRAAARINVLRVPSTPDPATRQHIGDVCVLLLSGLLDAMRGQTLDVPDAAETQVTT
jgi:hypothetical protein